LFKTIAGTNACGSGATCDLSHSNVTDERARTVSYHLARRDSSFLFNLTSLAAAPIPPSTLFAGVGFTHQPIPGTGPYRVASATSHEIRYVRNRFFHEWSHAAQPDGNPDTIVMRFGLTPAQEATAVANGKADWTADQIVAATVRTSTTTATIGRAAVSVERALIRCRGKAGQRAEPLSCR